MITIARFPGGQDYNDFEQIDLLAESSKGTQTESQGSTSNNFSGSSRSIIAGALVVADNALDLIPFGSTASNLVNLTLKHVFFKNTDPAKSEYQVYLKHLEQKQTGECLVYGVPFIGNVLKLGSLTLQVVSYVRNEPDTKVKIDLQEAKLALKTHPLLNQEQVITK